MLDCEVKDAQQDCSGGFEAGGVVRKTGDSVSGSVNEMIQHLVRKKKDDMFGF